ncbi:hypothetical protein EHP00_107 [Ecytonucleospora hepatopenaei]|uniref:Uncharacterized protein n=1 Tax=Ecytonucleospora hepatopenaei TaxID=646526 RepID=A0A1W0E5Y6_9MICR|nr:hypothetical protein EHP00_107 [Ecytonucleospora hepatopenaei]
MLILGLKKVYSFIYSRKTQFKLLNLIVATCLLFPIKNTLNFMWQETLYNLLEHRELDKINEKITFGGKSKEDTILIVYEDVKYICDNLKRLDVQTKGIEVTSTDIEGNYFLKIYLKKSSNTIYVSNPLDFSVNSEIHTLARKMFGIKHNLTFYKIFDGWWLRNSRWRNVVTLEFHKDSIDEFIWFVRHINNLTSHYYGIYFYTPYKDQCIKGDIASLFVISVILLTLFEANLIKAKPHIIFTTFIMYKMCPLTALIANDENGALNAFMFLAINNKFAHVYCLICYIKILTKTIKNCKK